MRLRWPWGPKPGVLADRRSIGRLLVLWLVCLPLAWLFVLLAVEVPVGHARMVAAAFGWYGEEGTVTITGLVGWDQICSGTFVPDDGGAPRTGVEVHVSGSCDVGRVVTARLIRKDTGWLRLSWNDLAFAGGGRGAALSEMLMTGAFILLVGGSIISFAMQFPVTVLIELFRRWRRPAG